MKSTKTKPKLNVKLLRKIKAHILEEPRRFFMEWYVATGRPGARRFTSRHADAADLPKTVPPCGTAACIAGWAILLSEKKKADELDYNYSGDTVDIASDLIGLPFGYYPRQLFNNHGWPEPFSSQYKNAKTPRARAKIAAERIEHLIKTSE